ncbi:unnamed protein product [Rotaria sp. Silwood1]|nr:unnamed protein product [Rotaria sp. Silwood1]CAF1634052.1 unnamed protein product [Rotaria sp. Silwood1]
MSIYIYEIHHSLQQTNTSVIISNNQAQSDTISCLSTLIFDCLAQALTGIQIFLLNIRQQLIVSSSSTATKSSNISSQISLNNSITVIHTIKDFNNLNCHMDITPKIYTQLLKNVTYKKIITIYDVIVGQYFKNDIWRLYEICTHIYRLLQQPNENTNSLYNEQRMINSSSII